MSREDERIRRILAARTLRPRHLPRRKRRDLAAIEARRRRLLADDRAVELRYYPAPWQPAHARLTAEGTTYRVKGDVVGNVCGRISVGRRAALTLYALVREFSPRRVLEMGTGVGISGAYQAMALRHDARGGAMVALEGAPDLAAIASETYSELALDPVEVRSGAFFETLPRVLAEGPLDYAYVDGHHEERATFEYFKLILPHAPSAVLVFDDIGWSEGMRRAWRRIAADPGVNVAVDLGRIGIALTGKAGRARRFRLARRRSPRPSELVSRVR